MGAGSVDHVVMHGVTNVRSASAEPLTGVPDASWWARSALPTDHGRALGCCRARLRGSDRVLVPAAAYRRFPGVTRALRLEGFEVPSSLVAVTVKE
jgi:hypothetical protein